MEKNSASVLSGKRHQTQIITDRHIRTSDSKKFNKIQHEIKKSHPWAANMYSKAFIPP
jgi:hypothetical protein